MRILPNRRRTRTLKTSTTREFDGGLNVIDNDLNLDSKFAKRLRNLYRAADGSIQKRWGTRLFSDLQDLGSEIVNMQYFGSVLIQVDDAGRVFAVDGRGTVYLIWDTEIAARLPGNPAGWGATDFVSFDSFNGSLIVCNGLDKPLIINSSYQVDYLQDEVLQSNINTPVAKYVRTHDRYLLLAGDPENTSTLYISNSDTAGTWVGDPDPNDSVSIDLGTRVSTGRKDIIGIGRFRDKAVICFEQCVMIMTLGIYDSTGAIHEPRVDEIIDLYGAASHRSIQALGEDFLFSDIVGVQSLARSAFNTTLKAERVSELIDPEIQAAMSRLSITSLQDRVFSVHNRLEGQYMLFVPNGDTLATTTETKCFVFTSVRTLKVNAWAEFRGWNFRSAARSAEGRVFFSRGGKTYVLGNEQDKVYADAVNDEETYDDGTVHLDGSGFTPVSANAGSGIPIDFDWIWPWRDFGARMNSKTVKYMQLDTLGTSEFTVSMFVDNIVYDLGDPGEDFTDGTHFTDRYGFEREDYIYTPHLSMDFVGGDRLGFGADGFGQAFGGGRPTREERLYSWPAKGNIFKMRVHGSSKDPLSIVSVTLAYNKGGVMRA